MGRGSWRARRGPGKADCVKKLRERVDIRVVQKPPYKVAATADEEGALAWAPASGGEMVKVAALWGEGREQETAGGLQDGSRERGLEGWDEVMG